LYGSFDIFALCTISVSVVVVRSTEAESVQEPVPRDPEPVHLAMAFVVPPEAGSAPIAAGVIVAVETVVSLPLAS
jgi:hypothetical protein